MPSERRFKMCLIGFPPEKSKKCILLKPNTRQVVHSMKAESEGLSGNMFKLDVLTSAGDDACWFPLLSLI